MSNIGLQKQKKQTKKTLLFSRLRIRLHMHPYSRLSRGSHVGPTRQEHKRRVQETGHLIQNQVQLAADEAEFSLRVQFSARLCNFFCKKLVNKNMLS